jgi:hypothetical protein
MNAPFLSLARFQILSVYAPSRRGLEGGAGRPSAKKIAKAIGVVALVVLVVADLGLVFGMMNWSMYKALKPTGLQDLLLLNAAITASALVFVMGFLTAISTYCSGSADASLIALPLRGRELLGAKMAMVYLSEFAFAAFLFIVAAVIYAIGEAPPASFYLGALLSALAIPLVPLAVAYLLIVPLMIAGSPLRNKNAIMVIGGVLGMAFALAFNFYIQGATTRMNDSAWVLEHFAGPDALLAKAGLAYPPALLAWRAMTARGLAGVGYGLAELALGLAAALAVVLALGEVYARSLRGFDEKRLKRVAATKDFMDRSFRRRPPIAALFAREWRLMNREPIFFLNGPFVILMMPLVLAVVFIAQKGTMSALLSGLGSAMGSPYPMLAFAAIGAFLGSSTSIACTALSRDAHALPYLKAMPLKYRDYMLAKFLHALAFALVGSALCGIGGLTLGIGALESAGAFLIALAYSAFASIVGLWIDTANPRLEWDTPTAALKQNPNAVIFILGVMATIAGLGVGAAFIKMGKLAFFALFFGAFAALAAAALAAYPRYAQKRIDEIEA